ncbi:hypothetical protein [Alkalicoccobacillus murimartini]|uniref:Uncharacterized protein n=1 Tax=Alkalicoccobacillus murimartini TaxID=171685 RepID=A0ABT9YKK0_9BACI|nr:hypothetical protein [Alkalicoccobacillus murimartini]MDQ0208398.1 hypothetical protein [Alkalicoccobacillus murimartini]
MLFDYTAPAIGRTDKSFIIEHDQKEIGQMERYFTKQTRNPQYDVNILAKDFTSDDDYKINQTEIKLFGGTKWDIYKNGEIIGRAEYPKGFFKAHQVVVRLDNHPMLTMKVKFDRTASLLNEYEDEIGRMKRTTSFKRTYEGEVDDQYIDMPLMLFYSLLHTFWCSSHIG